MANQEELMIRCISIANRKYDGHLTIMKFTTNWKVCFGTPNDRDDIQNMGHIIDGKYGSKMLPQALLGSLLSWQYKYGLRIYFMPKRYSGNFIYYQFYYYMNYYKDIRA